MGVRLEVPADVLRTARDNWDAVSDDLTACRRTLATAGTQGPAGGLADDVASAVAGFADVWSAELEGLAHLAEEYGAACVVHAQDTGLADTAAAEVLRALLPWEWHTAPITTVRQGIPGTPGAPGGFVPVEGWR